MFHKLAVALILGTFCLVTIGCSKYKVITDPPGARVFINGEYIGVSPIEAKAECKNWDRPIISIKKEGFEPIPNTKLSYETSWKLVLLEIPIWPAIFFNSECPKDEYHFVLDPIQAAAR